MSSSGTIASFLSRLLRPDRKEQSPSSSTRADQRKRHSAPVPQWFDVNDLSLVPPPASPVAQQQKTKKRQKVSKIEELPEEPQTSNPQKRQNVKQGKNKEKNKKQPKGKQNKENAILGGNKADVEKANKENQKKSKAARRHSSALSYWFCVSGNADTLERGLKAPYSRDEKTAAEKQDKKSELRSIPEQEATGSGKDISNSSSPKPVKLAGVIRRDGKRKKGDPKNRHSAPPDTLAVYRPKERPLTPNQFKGVLTQQHTESPRTHLARERVRNEMAPSPTRSVSPGVRYRVDGTLERPYVFPSGLTFGPEGRKTKLRSTSTSPVSETPAQPIGLNTSAVSTVVADVHDTSLIQPGDTKPPQQRYYHGSNPNIADVSYDDFDIHKALYLRYDSDSNKRAQSPANEGQPFRYSMPVCPDAVSAFKDPADHSTNFRPQISNVNNVSSRAVGAIAQTHESTASTERYHRYSLPPKNEDFVYMGSRDNLNMWNDFIERHEQTASEEGTNGSGARPKRRYSSPVQNTEFVYMGSIENIQLLNVEDKRAGCLSLKRDDDAYFLTGSGAMPASPGQLFASNNNTDPGIHNSSLSETDEHGVPNVGAQDISVRSDGAQPFCLNTVFQEIKEGDPKEFCQSLPDLSLPPTLSLVTINPNDQQVDSQYDKENFSGCEMGKSSPSHNPFSRNLGRKSCMPGNKKAFLPPPAVFSHSDTSVQLMGDTGSVNHQPINVPTQRFPFMSGNKRFKLPPPPNYTPPREEMEDAHARLMRASSCDKGSQTNLNDEALYSVNMEDRDLSLSLRQAKTMRANISATESSHTPEIIDRCDRVDQGVTSAGGKDKATKVKNSHVKAKKLNISTTSSQGSDDVFNDGIASDAGWKKEGFKFPTRGKYSLAGVGPSVAMKQVNAASGNLQTGNGPTDRNFTYSGFPQSNGASVSTNFGQPKTNIPKSDSNAEETLVSATTNDTFTAIESISKVVTSTPKISRKQDSPVLRKPVQRDSISSDTVRPVSTLGSDIVKPVPTPRKRYSTLGLCGYSSSGPSDVKVESTSQKESLDGSQLHHTGASQTKGSVTNGATRTPPVPKKRRNFSQGQTNSDTASSAEDHNRSKSSAFPTSLEPKTANGDNDTNSEHFPPQTSCNDSENETKYRESHNNQGNSTSLHRARKNDSIVSRPRHGRGVSFDDTCIADDELSCLEDQDDGDKWRSGKTTLQRRRRSMRKCVSVDDLLSSGSILDRSMILARKRRRRMRDRKCRSQMLLSSSEEEDAADDAARGPRGDRLAPKTRQSYKNKYDAGIAEKKAEALPPSFVEKEISHKLENHRSERVGSRDLLFRSSMQPWEIGLQNMPTWKHYSKDDREKPHEIVPDVQHAKSHDTRNRLSELRARSQCKQSTQLDCKASNSGFETVV